MVDITFVVVIQFIIGNGIDIFVTTVTLTTRVAKLVQLDDSESVRSAYIV